MSTTRVNKQDSEETKFVENQLWRVGFVAGCLKNVYKGESDNIIPVDFEKRCAKPTDTPIHTGQVYLVKEEVLKMDDSMFFEDKRLKLNFKKDKENGITYLCRGEEKTSNFFMSAKGFNGYTKGFTVFIYGRLLMVVNTIAEAKRMILAR